MLPSKSRTPFLGIWYKRDGAPLISSRHFPESKQLTKRRFYEQLRDPRPSTTTATTARNTLHILRKSSSHVKAGNMSSSPPRGGFTVDSGAAGDGTPSAPRGEVVSGGHGRQASEFTPEDRKAALRQQQQRLLHLWHASKCDVAQGTPCPVTPHCQNMKQLWIHIAECKNDQCPTPHCVTSRFVLTHYHRCNDGKCAVCAPVREMIVKSHERHRARSLGTADL
ncbi:unnamed protein product [Ascophyllum nodosum]